MQLQADRKTLVDMIRRLTGKGGKPRTFTGPGERARTAVRKAIKRAIDDIAAAEPDIGETLRTTITTGATCCYTPDDANPVRWTHTATP